jgi:uncharacterized membrane protein
MNPSLSIANRARTSILIFVGLCISIYLALFQLHVLPSVWDPFFSIGSIQVLESPLSSALPVPDSLIGAFGYDHVACREYSEIWEGIERTIPLFVYCHGDGGSLSGAHFLSDACR